ncbi:hypothetical protein A2382_02825 [Candidatus Woesebacteria bacterium RIFOXYB1_FULL_38_16]|uniref:Uncharacterized protein n=1 Tax=Candidatus Woesebacteria bacterium RIFOXYB1_FULL_38_16 TaxID=1802538 RepID=A0A1F8CS56_9BACT|nr:MAG: hypothetical protein A2191_04670 [Candidatus Woesebacteria bacterium RIFOXYA1_FULL_38_9]OGM79144.1 MAG: hypothetical protein A2382_02825 [Candidatus Woesebacteria bacterium RIFOXYB1_FULL_38_16]
MGDQNQNQQPVGAPVMGEVTDPSMPSVTQSPTAPSGVSVAEPVSGMPVPMAEPSMPAPVTPVMGEPVASEPSVTAEPVSEEPTEATVVPASDTPKPTV